MNLMKIMQCTLKLKIVYLFAKKECVKLFKFLKNKIFF
jgi:hypothetical protein